MFIKTITLALALGYAIIPASQNLLDGRATNNVSINENSEIQQKDNSYAYVDENGKTRTVYLAQGVNAPKMTSDPSLDGKPGYFHKDVTGTFVSYEQGFEPGNGYYDFNKADSRWDVESNLCYLGQAANMLKWWIDQNRVSIDKYIANIQAGNIYDNYPGIKPISPYNKQAWDMILHEPVDEIIDGKKSQTYFKQDLITQILGPYYNRNQKAGYHADMVLDFFFNGYEPLRGDNPFPNNESDFENNKSLLGGYFFPLIGNKRLTMRDADANSKVNYDWLDKNLQRLFREGNIVGLGYYTSQTSAHALTLWGAEYDENNKLSRFFVTDSDDRGNFVANSEYLRGMHAVNARRGSNGNIHIGTNTAPGQLGAKLSSIYVLSSAKDQIAKAVDDITPPQSYQFTDVSEDLTYGIGHETEIHAFGEENQPGIYSYQWYVANDPTSKGEAIQGATKNTLKVSSDVEGDKYYHYEVKLLKNGKVGMTDSRRIKVTFSKNVEIIDAQVPIVNMNTYLAKYNQYDVADKIQANAHVTDNGVLTYQWYWTNSSQINLSNSFKIEGETKPYFIPDTTQVNEMGRAYFVVVTNTLESANGIKVRTGMPKFAKMVKVFEVPGVNEAKTFAQEFMDINICGTNDNTKADSTLFKSMQSKYELLSDEAKSILRKTKGDQYSTDIIKQAIARYDRIISLHGNDSVNYPDYMQRKGTPAFTEYAAYNDNFIQSEDYVILVSALTFVLFAGVIGTAFIVYKRRKENR